MWRDHPLQGLAKSDGRRALAWLTAASLLLAFVLNAQGAPLRTAEAPAGIISYEFAGTGGRAAAILASWSAPAREAAAFNLGLDYLFMPLYASALALGCLVAGRRRSSTRWRMWGCGSRW